MPPGVTGHRARHLKLQLYYTRGKPVRRTLDIWPPFPIVLEHINPPLWDVNNIVSALECNERVRDIDLKRVASSQLAEMNEIFSTSIMWDGKEAKRSWEPDIILSTTLGTHGAIVIVQAFKNLLIHRIR
ncbi:hypothetical protein V8E52_005183 [Russula decolorans]|jgi:hypothetical protein